MTLRIERLKERIRLCGEPADLKSGTSLAVTVGENSESLELYHERPRTRNVQTELVDLETRFQLWGGQCSRKLSDSIELQEEISREICQHLRLRLSRGESRRLRTRDTGSPEAYQLSLKGRYCLEKRTLEGLHKAIEYLNQATKIDPRYSLAYTGLADAYTLQGSGTYGAMPSKNARAPLKRLENVDYFDIDTDFNPLHLRTLRTTPEDAETSPALSQRRIP
jgi:hypothetical protein